jgi:hypothetical protein
MLPPPTCTVNDPSGSTPGQRLLRSDADGSGPLDGISVPSYVPTGVVRWINPAVEQLLATLVVVTTPRSSRPIGGEPLSQTLTREARARPTSRTAYGSSTKSTSGSSVARARNASPTSVESQAATTYSTARQM